MKKEYPNGSVEYIGWEGGPILRIEAPSPFGTIWSINCQTGVHNQSTGNPDAQGVHRRNRKWYLDFEKDIGWKWI